MKMQDNDPGVHTVPCLVNVPCAEYQLNESDLVEAHMVRISVQASIGLHRGSSFILFPRMENDFNRFAAFCQLNAFVYLIQRKDMSDKFLCWE